MERFEPKSERIITQEEREYLNRVLGSFGLYDASQDEYDVPEHQDEPVAFINVGEREFEVNRGNTRLYTFIGRLALYDHVHYSDRENDVAFYVFNFVNGYNELASFVAENDFTMYLNQTEVPQCDLDAYDRSIKASMQGFDSVPEEWLGE